MKYENSRFQYRVLHFLLHLNSIGQDRLSVLSCPVMGNKSFLALCHSVEEIG